MTVRRARRIGYGFAGGYLLLLAHPLSYLLFPLAIRHMGEEMRVPEAASTAVTKAILETKLGEETEAYQAYSEHVRQVESAVDDYSIDSDIRPTEDMLTQLREDRDRAEQAMHAAFEALQKVA